MARDAEYDRFGPWVIEISPGDPAPALFEPYLSQRETPLLAIKIPRKIARREAHPGMDLYDYVVSLYERDLLALQRLGHDVRAVTIPYGEIQHLRVREDLLRGNLHLAISGGPFDLPYNTVSSEVMGRVVGMLHERCRPPGWAPVPPPAATPIGELSFYFEGRLRAMREDDPDMQPLAAQADTALRSAGGGLVRRTFQGIVDKRLLESLHQTDGEVLAVMDRGQPYAYRWQSVYGRLKTWIPLANITGATWDDDPGGVTSTLTVGTRGGRCSWAFLRDNPTIAPYAAFLARLAS